MRSIFVGGLVAAIVMFALGFVFFRLLGVMAFDATAPEVAGGAPAMLMALIAGFIHMAVTAMLMALALSAAGGDFQRQAKVVLWFGLAAAVFLNFGGPIWSGVSWQQALFQFVADVVRLIAGGLVLARWFTSERAAG